MSLLVYGIVAKASLPAGFDTGLSLIDAEDLTAVTWPVEDAAQDIESVLAFGKVVERIHRHTAIIPMRYGSLLPDEPAVKSHLLQKAQHYRQRLQELQGCEEMGVRLPMPESPSMPMPKAVSGKDYLTALKHKYAVTEQAEREASQLDVALEGLYRRRCGEAGRFANQPMYLASYLVPRELLPAFRARLDELSQSGQLNGLVSGPWPPYNFAA